MSSATPRGATSSNVSGNCDGTLGAKASGLPSSAAWCGRDWRDMRTVYRIVRINIEVYRGKQIAVKRKAATLVRAGADLDDLKIQTGKSQDYVTDPPAGWTDAGAARQLLTS